MIGFQGTATSRKEIAGVTSFRRIGSDELGAKSSFFFFLMLFRDAPEAYGGSQAGGRIRAIAAGLGHSHSNTGSELRLQATPQLRAMPDP